MDDSTQAAATGSSTPFALSMNDTAPGSSSPFRNRVVAFNASGSRMARTAATPGTTQFQANNEHSFALPPEMCRRSYYTEIEGGHLETSAAVVLTAHEAQVLGYHHPTNPSNNHVGFNTGDAGRQALPPGFLKTASAGGLIANPLTGSAPGAVSTGGRIQSSRSIDVPSIRHPHPTFDTASNGSRRQVSWASFNPLTAIQGYGSDSDYLASDASHPASPATPVELISPASSTPNSPGNDATKVQRHYEAGRAPLTPEEDGVQVKITQHARPGDDAGQHSLKTTVSGEIGFAHHAAPQPKPSEISPQTASLLSPANFPWADTLMSTPRRPSFHRALPTASQSSSPAPKGWNERIFRSSSAPPVQRVVFASAADTPDPADVVAPSRPKSCDGYSHQQELFSSMVPKLGIRFGWSAKSLDGLAPAYVSQPGLETNCTNDDMRCLVPAVDYLSLQSPACGKNERLPCEIDSGGLLLPQVSAHASSDTLNRSSKPWGKVLAHWEQQKAAEDEVEQLDDSAASVHLNEAPATSNSEEQISFQNSYSQDSDVDMGADENGPASGLPGTPYLSARSSPVGQVSSIGHASGDLALAPTVKPKAQNKTRQLIQVQTYSAAILGGAAMLAETRTRQQAKVQTPDPASPSPANKSDEAGNQAISSAAAGDQGPEAPDVADNKRPGKKRTAKQSDLAPDASAVPGSSKRARGDAPSRWAPEEDTILKAHFIDGVVNAPKAEDCLKDMVKAGYTRSVAAIMTRARDKIKKGLI